MGQLTESLPEEVWSGAAAPGSGLHVCELTLLLLAALSVGTGCSHLSAERKLDHLAMPYRAGGTVTVRLLLLLHMHAAKALARCRLAAVGFAGKRAFSCLGCCKIVHMWVQRHADALREWMHDHDSVA
jgi:hypothetical protein